MKELVGGVSIQMLSALCINLVAWPHTRPHPKPKSPNIRNMKMSSLQHDNMFMARPGTHPGPVFLHNQIKLPFQTSVMSSRLWILTKKFIHNTSNFSFWVFLVVYWYRPSRCTYSHLQKFTTTQRVTIRMHTKLARPQLLLLPQKQLSWAWIDIWMSVSSKCHACFRNLF